MFYKVSPTYATMRFIYNVIYSKIYTICIQMLAKKNERHVMFDILDYRLATMSVKILRNFIRTFDIYLKSKSFSTLLRSFYYYVSLKQKFLSFF